MHLYSILEPLVGAIIKPIWRPTVTGQSNIPTTRAVVMAVSHQSAAETYFVPCMIDREVHWLGKNDLFNGASIPGRIFSWIMRSCNVIPVDRTGAGKASAAIEAGTAVLKEGKLLGIFPEGTRSPDGRLHRGKTGAVRMALAADAVIVPVTCLGSYESQVKGSILPKFSPRLRVVIGEPIDISAKLAEMRAEAGRVPDTGELAARTTSDELRALTLHMMHAIQKLSGQEYVDEYAADVKRRLKAEADS